MGKSTQGKMVCDYCGTTKDTVVFVIGASREPEWVMNEGTGKISCPACFDKGRAEGQARIKAHIKALS